MDHLTLGKISEEKAAAFLEKNGLKKITSRFRSRFGEIDLIMEDQDTLVFIEVKFRKTTEHGSGAESVNKLKQNKIVKTALTYLQKEKIFEKKACRFDVIEVSQDKLQWIKNAF